MKLYALPFIALALAGCQSAQVNAERERNTLVTMSYTGALLKYSCGYRPQACHPDRGYSKDSGYRVQRSSPRVQARPVSDPQVQRQGGVMEAYRMGPYVDPTDPRVLHGAHTVTRVLREPAWRLREPQVAPPALQRPDPEPSKELGEVKALKARLAALEEAQKVNAEAQNQNQQVIKQAFKTLQAQLPPAANAPAAPALARPYAPVPNE
jgi:hypothetical protein